MILAEQLVLLAIDAQRGTIAEGISPERLRAGAAGALLAELVLHQRLADSEHGLVLDAGLPDFHPLLAETARALHGRVGLAPADAVRRVARSSGKLVLRLTRNLVTRDILHDYREAFVLHRHPVRSMQALREVGAAINAVTTGGPHAPGAFALAALADACGVLAVRLSAEERLVTRRRIDDETRRADGDSGRDIRLVMAFAAAVAD